MIIFQIEGGCAHKDGRLMVGDLILEVNSKDIRKSAYNDVAFLLKTLPQGKVSLKIGRLKTSASASISNSTSQSANTSKTTSRRNSITNEQVNDNKSAAESTSAKAHSKK
jgi:C-terminal processing protease CtpA/Prc